MTPSGKPKRRAMRRAQREARRAAGAPLAGLAWDTKGLEGRATEEIVAALGALGIEVSEEGFRELAVAHGKVEAVAEVWEQGRDLPPKWEHIPYFAARALWPRWAPDVFAPEVFLHEHFPDFLLFDEQPTTLENGQEHWRAASATMDLLAPSDAAPRPDLFEQLEFHSGYDLGWWMAELPFALADPRAGMVDEAVQLCRRMATVCEAGDYLGTLGVILWEAGRREEALRQIAENLERFPEHVWVRIKAGDVYRKAGDPARAEALYREAYDMTDAAHAGQDRYEAVERLLDLYREAGRDEEYVNLAVAEADLIDHWERDAMDEADEAGWPEDEPWDEDEGAVDAHLPPAEADMAFAPPLEPPAQPAQRSTPKIGRNEPCPCGSGKKYKRCCGA